MGLLDNVVSKLSSLGQSADTNASAPATSGGTTVAAGESTGKCPNCGNNLVFARNEKTVTCYYCDVTSSVEDVQKSSGSASGLSSSEVASIAMTIDTPESGLVYVDNFYANYDWEAYKQVSEIGIEEVDGMVEKNKIKNGANSAAWILDFESKIVPLTKKLEGLKEAEAKMAEKYDPVDNTAALDTFDVYARIVHTLVDSKDAIVKRLANDVEYAKKFGAEATVCAGMSARLNEVQGALDSLKVVEHLNEVEAIVKAKEALNKKIINELAAQGIDAVATYRAAMEIYEGFSADKSRALELFESVKKYADSAEYIASINRYFLFKGANEYIKPKTLFSFLGRYFLFDTASAPVVNTEEGGKSDATQQAPVDDGPAGLALYEIVEGVRAKEPLFKGLTSVLGCYANKIYYIAKNKKICSYDVVNHVETVIDEGKNDCYTPMKVSSKKNPSYRYVPGNFFVANDGKGFFMRKILSLKDSKLGCWGKVKEFFATLFKKKKAPTVRKNNYSIVYVDMATGTQKVLVEELIDIVSFHGNELFYILADEDPKSEAIHFRVCDVASGETAEILDDTCDIYDVTDDKVVYSRWTPNDYNKDLYVLDLNTQESTLIEKNIYNFFKVINGRIYYTVGNTHYQPLFSNNTEGTDRLEIMQNVEDLYVRGGWLYLIKGTGRNTALVKMSPDGKEKFIVCTQFKQIIEFTDSFIYYLDTRDTLRVVRNDGKDNRAIAPNMNADNIVVGYDSIYYLRPERVSSSKNAYSLYKMDFSGHNTRKLIFSVDAMKNYDKDSLYLKRVESARFEITTPVTAKENSITYQDRVLTRYFKFNKNNEDIQTVLTLGMPDAKECEIPPTGCFKFFKKPKKAQSTVREVPKKSEFKRLGVAAPGAVYNKQMAEAEAAANAKK